MKRIIAVIIIAVSILSFSACDKDEPRIGLTYNTHYYGSVYEDFLQKYEENKEKIPNDFYVLAPQDYREEASLNPLWGINFYESTEEGVLKGAWVYQTFYVCNEQKYGEQTTDWGQVGGIATNFRVAFTSNPLYAPTIGEEVVIKHVIPTYSKVRENYLDLYQGEKCFASVVFEFLGKLQTDGQRRIFVENYIKENLMPYSEYVTRNENGDFSPSTLAVDSGENPKYERAFWDLGTTIESVRHFSDETHDEQLQKYGLSFLYFETLPKKSEMWDEWPKFDVDVKAKDIDESGNAQEIYFVSKVECWDYNLKGGNRFAPYVTNMRIDMITVPFYVEDFNVDLIRIEKITDDYVNLYYEDICCATVQLGCGYEYFENYVKTYLRYYTPSAESENAL